MTWGPIGVWPLKGLKVQAPPKDDSIAIFGSLVENVTAPMKSSEMLPLLLGNVSLVPPVFITFEFNNYVASQPPCCVCFNRILKKNRLTSLSGSDMRNKSPVNLEVVLLLRQ